MWTKITGDENCGKNYWGKNMIEKILILKKQLWYISKPEGKWWYFWIFLAKATQNSKKKLMVKMGFWWSFLCFFNLKIPQNWHHYTIQSIWVWNLNKLEHALPKERRKGTLDKIVGRKIVGELGWFPINLVSRNFCPRCLLKSLTLPLLRSWHCGQDGAQVLWNTFYCYFWDFDLTHASGLWPTSQVLKRQPLSKNRRQLMHFVL